MPTRLVHISDLHFAPRSLDQLAALSQSIQDTTPDILRRLADDGLPLALSREGYGIFYQGPSMTQLIRRACDDHPWDFIIPLDCDEFLRVPDRATDLPRFFGPRLA